MKIYIEFYASLMKYLPPGQSRFRRDIIIEESMVLSDLIKQYQISKKEAHIVLVNGHFVNFEDRDSKTMNENDTVAIWPPVAGG